MRKSSNESADNDIANGGIVDMDTSSEHDDDVHVVSNRVLQDLYNYVKQDRAITLPHIKVGHVIASLRVEGLLFWRDKRFTESQDYALSLANEQRNATTGRVSEEVQIKVSNIALSYDQFVRFIGPCARLVLRAFSEELVIPDWEQFTTDLEFMFEEVKTNETGNNANYIPILRDANSARWGLSICSIDGQRFSIGDYTSKHTLQSTSKPVTYALGLALEGAEFMDQWIDVEPAGRPFNTQDLNPDSNRPFNACVNSGAIMAAGCYASRFPDESWREIVQRIQNKWYRLCGSDLDIGFSQETYESEKSCAYYNFAISYNLKGRKGLPRDVDLHKMLDVYLGCCSIEITAEALAVAAATLANGGVCPITGQEVFPAHVVRHVLSETMMCGMYDQAGHFCVEVGLPAKSGVSGALMVIVPNSFGFATFSPKLNKRGNSVRGVDFCKRLVERYRVHLFEPLKGGNSGAKIDPRNNGLKNERMEKARLAWAVQVGDTYALRLRTLFLTAMCQTAASSAEGLSKEMIDTIKKSYEQVFQVPVETELLNIVLEKVRTNPADTKYIEDLKGMHVSDSVRSLIGTTLNDIVMMKGKINEVEKNEAIRINNLLGVNKNVTLMELHRHEHHIGHRLKNIKLPARTRSRSADARIVESCDDILMKGSAKAAKHGTKTAHEEGIERALVENDRSVERHESESKKIQNLQDEVHRLKAELDEMKKRLQAQSG